jgi:O-antigen/teichoic acid export membrane protein
MTVSNVISPVMVYLDRFMLAVLVPVSLVTYYAIPFEVVTKLWIIPGAVVSVLFPAFATSLAHDRSRTALLYRRAVKWILLAIFPLALIVITLAPEALHLWLGGEFAVRGTVVVYWLVVGVLLNSVGYVPVGLLHGAGRPDLVAKLQALEAPFYVLGLLYMTRWYGIEGAAAAWTFRVAVDSVALCYLVHSLGLVPHRFGRLVAFLAAGLAALSFPLLTTGLGARLSYLLVVLLLFLPLTWFVALSSEERRFLAESLAGLRRKRRQPP